MTDTATVSDDMITAADNDRHIQWQRQ